MSYEVEQKYPVADLEALVPRIDALGAEISEPRVEVDLYFAHPVRDFAATDEALRLRACAGEVRITYKGPKLDQATKTRREIELPLGSAATTLDEWRGLLEVLGFRPVAEVRKTRPTDQSDIPRAYDRYPVHVASAPIASVSPGRPPTSSGPRASV